MPPKPWKTISTRPVYQNPWIKVREDIAEMPNGRQTIYGVVECQDAVGILPFIDPSHVIMVRQYRYVFGEDQRWEMPTGGARPGESLLEAAHRELQEEIGFDAGQLQYLSTAYSSKSVMSEIAHMYIGRNLVSSNIEPDETEFLEVATFSFDEVLSMVLNSQIRDSMTVMAVLLAARIGG